MSQFTFLQHEWAAVFEAASTMEGAARRHSTVGDGV